MLVKLPSPEASAKFTTVQEAIGDLPPLKCGERGPEVKEYICEPMCDYQRRARIGSCGIYNHEAPRLSKENQERLKYIKPGGNWTDIPDELLPKGRKRARKSDHTKRYGVVLLLTVWLRLFDQMQTLIGALISTTIKIVLLLLEKLLDSNPFQITLSLLVRKDSSSLK